MNLELIKSEIKMTSRDIAELTGKNHADVMRDIRSEIKSMKKEGENGESIFELSSYKTSQNKDVAQYILTKDGAMQIATRYSAGIRRKLIKRISELENSKLQENHKANLLLSIYNGGQEAILSAKQLTEIEVAEQTKVLTDKIEEDKPKVSFADAIISTGESIDMNAFAKVIKDEGIKMGRNKLFAWLRDHSFLMDDNLPYQRYIDNSYFEVIEVVKKTVYGEKVYLKTLVKPKGQISIVEKLKNQTDDNYLLSEY